MATDRNYIGSYRLLKLVRAGATCQIWEVIHEADNRRCALKTLQDEHRTNRDEIALLKHEYAVGHDLKHANLIEIYEFNIAKGIPYLALEYFESQNLKQWLRQSIDGAGFREQVPAVIQQAAEGLQYLHQQGWLHRDVKPDNFLVNTATMVKLIDLAIAEKPKSMLGRLLGGKGKIQGTRSYMSPEQIRGERLDFRSDVYSFGCMTFELLCGRPPFTGGTPDELLQKHLQAPVPALVASNNDVTPELANLVTRMMSKKREGRPTSMQEFLDLFGAMRVFKPLRR